MIARSGSTVLAVSDCRSQERRLASNEALCLTLAAACRLTTATCRILRTGDRTSLVVDRYDRERTVDGARRVHQVDMLSAMGRDPSLKYERGGQHVVRAPSLDDLAALVERHLGRAGLVRFIEVVTFNVVIGNADAHPRNLSFLLGPDGTVGMAPLYDLVCTRMYDHLDTEVAQSINGVRNIDEVSLADLRGHARRWGLTDQILQRVPAIVETVVERSDTAVDRVVRLGAEREIAEHVARTIRARAGRLLG